MCTINSQRTKHAHSPSSDVAVEDEYSVTTTQQVPAQNTQYSTIKQDTSATSSFPEVHSQEWFDFVLSNGNITGWAVEENEKEDAIVNDALGKGASYQYFAQDPLESNSRPTTFNITSSPLLSRALRKQSHGKGTNKTVLSSKPRRATRKNVYSPAISLETEDAVSNSDTLSTTCTEDIKSVEAVSLNTYDMNKSIIETEDKWAAPTMSLKRNGSTSYSRPQSARMSETLEGRREQVSERTWPVKLKSRSSRAMSQVGEHNLNVLIQRMQQLSCARDDGEMEEWRPLVLCSHSDAKSPHEDVDQNVHKNEFTSTDSGVFMKACSEEETNDPFASLLQVKGIQSDPSNTKPTDGLRPKTTTKSRNQTVTFYDLETLPKRQAWRAKSQQLVPTQEASQPTEFKNQPNSIDSLVKKLDRLSSSNSTPKYWSEDSIPSSSTTNEEQLPPLRPASASIVSRLLLVPENLSLPASRSPTSLSPKTTIQRGTTSELIITTRRSSMRPKTSQKPTKSPSTSWHGLKRSFQEEVDRIRASKVSNR